MIGQTKIKPEETNYAEYHGSGDILYRYYWARHSPTEIFIGFLNQVVGAGLVRADSTVIELANQFNVNGEQINMIKELAIKYLPSDGSEEISEETKENKD